MVLNHIVHADPVTLFICRGPWAKDSQMVARPLLEEYRPQIKSIRSCAKSSPSLQINLIVCENYLSEEVYGPRKFETR